jgi:hypothetical protein
MDFRTLSRSKDKDYKFSSQNHHFDPIFDENYWPHFQKFKNKIRFIYQQFTGYCGERTFLLGEWMIRRYL